jgi:hypothetical protein
VIKVPKEALGERFLKKFNIGDYVSWKSFLDYKNIERYYEVHYGIITEFIREAETGREIIMARVLPIHSAIQVEIHINRIRKVETN